jgi:hypothetical protein
VVGSGDLCHAGSDKKMDAEREAVIEWSDDREYRPRLR